MNAHWILYLYKLKGKEEYASAYLHCSNCKGIPLEKGFYPIKEHYCHNCGAHMIEEPQICIKKSLTVYEWE